MGSPEKIRAQLESATGYARSIGLVETPQTFYAWIAGAADHGEPLRISADAQLQRLIGTRYVPAQTAPQLDLFFDNPVVVLANGIVRSLSARNMRDTQRQLDRLYAQAPNHAELAAFDRLLAALGHLDCPSMIHGRNWSSCWMSRRPPSACWVGRRETCLHRCGGSSPTRWTAKHS